MAQNTHLEQRDFTSNQDSPEQNQLNLSSNQKYESQPQALPASASISAFADSGGIFYDDEKKQLELFDDEKNQLQSDGLKLGGTYIIMQGWLQKRSKYIGSWRKRWTVMSMDQYMNGTICTYKNKNTSNKPTEIIQLSSIESVESLSDLLIHVNVMSCKPYEFAACTASDKTRWVNNINKYRNKCIKIPITTQCNRDNTYNDNFELIIPYDKQHQYSNNSLITDIINYAQQ
eukprot:416212_1